MGLFHTLLNNIIYYKIRNEKEEKKVLILKDKQKETEIATYSEKTRCKNEEKERVN